VADLKSKLDRIAGAAPGERRSESGPEERQATLGLLRRKLADLLGRVPAPPPPRPEPLLSELPFVCHQTASGPLYQRVHRLAPSYHVGRMPVDAAAAAAPEMLALLALEPGLAQCDLSRALYIDLETTGLGGGAGVVAFLVGMARFEPGGPLLVEQLLLRQPGEEAAMLEAVAERVEAAGLLVSYNGKAFDLPVLAARLVMNRMPSLPGRPHLDLLHVARRLHRARLGACRLTTLESEVLGMVRGEDIDGAEVPQRYSHFLRTGDEQGLRAVVEHNEWDLVSMAALLGLYGEPLGVLHPEDLAALARTLKRAGALDQAEQIVQAAVEQGGGAVARRARGEIAKARGDRMAALCDFEALSEELDDPALRLELAKLYEHTVKQPLRALELVEQGTGETAQQLQRRRARLLRKLGKRGGDS
jgi:uncharacterized protein YprB with RNaseH-like and TPR domain